MKRQVARVLAFSIALAMSALLAEAQTPQPRKGLVTGWAGGVVSPSMTSVFLSGHRGTRVGPLVVVYLHGASGWHQRQWKTRFLQNQSPGGVTLTGEDVVVGVEVDIDNDTVTLQDQTFARAENNVFLVVHADQPEAQRVVPLGRYELPPEQKLAVYLWDTQAAIRERIAAETSK